MHAEVVFAELLGLQPPFSITGIRQFDDDPDPAIEEVSIDMSLAFIRGVSEQLPQAEVALDRFHVERYLRKARRAGKVSADALVLFAQGFSELWQSASPAQAAALLMFLIDFAKEKVLL